MTINGPAPMRARVLPERGDRPAGREAGCSGTARSPRRTATIDAHASRGKQLPGHATSAELPARPTTGSASACSASPATRWWTPRTLRHASARERSSTVRGTVQADILKEDQAQNTCIFSTEFALRMMGDVQQFFIQNDVRNFYSVSISGYHIAEAGANPISQLAFTLSNGFTMRRVLPVRAACTIDDFAPNLSFSSSATARIPEYARDRPRRAAHLGAGACKRALRRATRAARC
jgi:methylmalonyl-CoA mutase